MDRRAFLVRVAGAVALSTAPLAAEAQEKGNVYRIGYLGGQPPPHQAFINELRQRGWVEGQNIVIERRYSHGKDQQLPALAAELVGLQVDVMVTVGGMAARAARQASSTTPIVMATSHDAVRYGLVASLARPGKNVTGLTLISAEIMGKRLELLKEVVPSVSRLAILTSPFPGLPDFMKVTEDVAQSLALTVRLLTVHERGDLTRAFATMVREKADALHVVEHPWMFINRKPITELALKHRLPTIFGLAPFVQAGGLISYGANLAHMFRRAAVFVDKILRGANPGGLPVEQPTEFEFVINLKTAKALGLTIPRSILVRADEVIE